MLCSFTVLKKKHFDHGIGHKGCHVWLVPVCDGVTDLRERLV